MTTSTITIDGRGLFNNRILIIKPDGNAINNDWLDCHALLVFNLEPGQYRFSSQATMSDCFFTVETDGSLSVLPIYQPFIEVQAGNTLKLKGYAVKVDARYLTGNGICWPTAHVPEAGDGYDNGFFKYDTIHLMPDLAYHISTGSGNVSSFYLKLSIQKEWQVLDGQTMLPNPVFNQFISIQNTAYIPELTIYGYPLLIDGRSAKYQVYMQDIGGRPEKGNNFSCFDDAGVLLANLLPLRHTVTATGEIDLATSVDSYSFQTATAPYAEPRFIVSNDGRIVFDPVYSLYFKLDHFNGMQRLTVTYPLPDRIW